VSPFIAPSITMGAATRSGRMAQTIVSDDQ
jgi:hypothetical protein